jgi:uncharacterized phage protein (TIGR02220 family)
MGASVRIEDEAFSDERYEDLATAAGLADADHARGKMARLWRQCTLEQRHVLPVATVQRILGERAVEALQVARLGELVDDGVRIRGTRGRIEWLKKLRNNGRFGKRGGRPRKNPQGFSEKPTRVSKIEKQLTPPAPSPALTPSPSPAPVQISEKNSATPSAGGAQLEILKSKVDAAVGEVGKRRAKPKPSDPTPSELGVAQTVLDKLGSYNGVRYTRTAEHTRLIVAHLRSGLTEADLRKVICYCAIELDWKSDRAMVKFLRPETLFGPKTISKYLDPARAWFDTLPSDDPIPLRPKQADEGPEWELPNWMVSGGDA